MNTANVEASIIGSLILYPELFQEAAKVLIPTRQSGVRVFREHNRIWDWMVKAQFEQMRGWDVQLVSSKFKDVPELIRQAEPETLSSSILYLREEYERAVLKKVCEDALQRLGEESPYSVASDVLSNLTDEEPEVKEKMRGDEILEALNSLKFGRAAVATISQDYDQITGGARRGQIRVLGASPMSGKTELVLKEMIAFAKQGLSCVFFSLELPKEDVYQRLFHIESGLSMETLSNQVLNENTGEKELKLSKPDAKKLSDAVMMIGKIPLFVYDIADVGDKLPLILQKIRLHIRNDDLFAYGIDYVQLAKTGIERIDSSGNKIRITQWVIDELGKATKRLKVYAIWVSKLNRDVMVRGGSFRPRNSDLYGGDFEYIADIIEFMHRPLAYEGLRGMEREDGYVYKDYDVEHIITKNRLFGGKVGSWWDYQEDEEPSEAPIFDLMKAKMPVLEEGEDLPF